MQIQPIHARALKKQNPNFTRLHQVGIVWSEERRLVDQLVSVRMIPTNGSCVGVDDVTHFSHSQTKTVSIAEITKTACGCAHTVVQREVTAVLNTVRTYCCVSQRGNNASVEAATYTSVQVSLTTSEDVK